MPIYVTALFSARPGCETELEAAALANIPNVRQEKGCMKYDLHKDGKGNYLVYETWASQEDLTVHGSAPHMQAYREKVKNLVTGPSTVTTWVCISQS